MRALITNLSANVPASMYITVPSSFKTTAALFPPSRRLCRKERRVRSTRHSIYFSNDEMLTSLRKLLRKHGTLTSSIIEEDGTAPCASAYRLRFGSIRQAYQLIGFTPSRSRKPFARRNARSIASITAGAWPSLTIHYQ